MSILQNNILSLRSIFYCLYFFISTLSAQAQKPKQVEIINADVLEFDQRYGKDTKRLIGNVQFKHDDVYMYCDSAHFNSAENIVDAYSNVHIRQGDTLHLYGDKIKYMGNTKFAEIRSNVRLIQGKTILTTEFLDFDRIKNVGYYFNKGKIVDGENELTSLTGYYYTQTREAFFKTKVLLKNPEYKMYGDTLKYNTRNKTAYFFGPTTIVSDSNLIYCENGWYNTKTEISQFNKNAYLTNKKQILKGDSLYYDRKKQQGRAFRNIQMIDSMQNVILYGNKAQYNELTQASMITDKTLLVQIIEKDSLFIHADTISTSVDTSGKYKNIRAYHKVKMFKTDLQGKCDSVFYSLRDSVIQLHRNPVLWSDMHQLTADYIEIHTKNNNVDYIDLQRAAFIISREDTIRFNQIKGKNMKGFFVNNKLYKVDITGNGQSLYFPKDKDQLVGANKAESTNMTIYIKDKKIERIKFITKPNATMSPIEDIQNNDLKLKDFKWLEKYRPLTKSDIFIWQ